MARLRLPTATEAVAGRESRHTQSYERARAGNPFPALPLPDDARASALEADAWLTAELKKLQQRFPPQGAVSLVGHAHIDTAWLWPIEETRRKVRRTFATAADLLRRHPQFRFAQSFAEYYRELEDEDPALLAEIKTRSRPGAGSRSAGSGSSRTSTCPAARAWCARRSTASARSNASSAPATATPGCPTFLLCLPNYLTCRTIHVKFLPAFPYHIF